MDKLAPLPPISGISVIRAAMFEKRIHLVTRGCAVVYDHQGPIEMF